jgi:uncharacterized SAM-binding protein YcdF (DUF218 family)
MLKEFLQIGAGAILLCSPIWAVWLLVRWLDRRPTAAERFARNHENVLRQRERINKHLLKK